MIDTFFIIMIVFWYVIYPLLVIIYIGILFLTDIIIDKIVKKNKNKNDKNIYLGVYDYKESDTFRPTLDKRVHFGSQISKTITTRTDSCGIILGKIKTIYLNTMAKLGR